MTQHTLALLFALVANLGAGMLLTYLATAPLRRLAVRQRIERMYGSTPVPVETPLQLPAPSAPIQSHVRMRRWS